jgi:hydroxymethylpyrimidine pyrophosphatase-like HAD family hydrolase
MVVASDLDRTLLYSPAALMLSVPDAQAPRLLCVEVYQGKPLSFMTETAAEHVRALNEAGKLIPVTTRTIAQYQRISLPGPTAKFAICANGGRLLRDGVEDLDFTAAVTDRLASASGPLEEVSAWLHDAARTAGADGFVKSVRDAEGLFCYLVVDRDEIPRGWVEELTGFAGERAWGVSVQGRKVYVVPTALTKSVAAREVAEMLGCAHLLAAGDSLLDGDLLEAADEAIRPAHGELADAGWIREHVHVTSAVGVMAGEEIASWMTGRVL